MANEAKTKRSQVAITTPPRSLYMFIHASFCGKSGLVSHSHVCSLIEIQEGLNPVAHLLHTCSYNHTGPPTHTHTASSYFTMLLNTINSCATSP